MRIILITLVILYLLRTRPGFGGLTTVLWPFGRDGASLLVVEFVPGGAYDEYLPGEMYAGMGNYSRNSTGAAGVFTTSGYCVLGVLYSNKHNRGIIILNRFVGLFLHDDYYLEAERRWIPPLVLR